MDQIWVLQKPLRLSLDVKWCHLKAWVQIWCLLGPQFPIEGITGAINSAVFGTHSVNWPFSSTWADQTKEVNVLPTRPVINNNNSYKLTASWMNHWKRRHCFTDSENAISYWNQFPRVEEEERDRKTNIEFISTVLQLWGRPSPSTSIHSGRAEKYGQLCFIVIHD